MEYCFVIIYLNNTSEQKRKFHFGIKPFFLVFWDQERTRLKAMTVKIDRNGIDMKHIGSETVPFII